MAGLAPVKAAVHGRVTGIGFRVFVRMWARRLGLSGYVHNLPDDTSVEVEAEGEKDELEKLMAYLHCGPPLARVERVDVGWGKYTGKYDDFSVKW